MANYKPDLSAQAKFIPVDFAQQILPSTFEYALVHVVEQHLDLQPFDIMYQNDHKGAAAYSLAIMLKIILYSYAHGLISSRCIAKACETNMALKALSGDTQPHFTSIARFVAKMHANPIHVRRFSGAIGLQAKTDKLDAKLIAHYGQAVQPKLSTLKPESMRLMADLVARRNQILTMQTMEKNVSVKTTTRMLACSFA